MILAGLCAAACGSERREPPPEAPPCLPLPPARAGRATHYQADGTGRCSFPASDDRMVVALATADYDEARWCGACLEVMTQRGASVTVRVVDKCPGCAMGDLDLSEEAFAQLAPLTRGRIKVAWRIVACPLEGPIALRWKATSTATWAALQVHNHRYPIERVELRRGGAAAFTPLARGADNYFVATAIGAGQATLRVTTASGQTLEQPATLAAGATRPGSAQFPLCP